MNNQAPALAGSVERAAFRASIPARGQGSRQTPEQMQASRDVAMYRAGRAARTLGRH